MKEGPEGAECATKQNDVIAVTDGPRKGAFVGVEAEEDAVEKGVRGLIGGFKITVELEEFRVEREDKGK